MQQNPPLNLQRIKLLATDFDGIHTDGLVYTDQDGHEMVRSSRIDSLGLDLLRRQTDVTLCVISKETNQVVAARCNKLQIPCYQAVETGEGKLDILKRVMAEQQLNPADVLYMGDDLTDIPILRCVGIPITVPHAHPLVKEVCLYVTKAPGGNGAIREVCEMLLVARGMELKF
jgi:YrbI family 3-deoxy-D-manno-octulosonate 8-phosphate phosphatase